MQEFTKNGFDNASTNEIVKEAKISKGSLFNYFDSKKNLYAYLIEYIAQVIDDLFEKIDLSETDLFKRIDGIGYLKLEIYQKSPYVLDFLAYITREESPEVKDIIQKKLASIYDRGIRLMYENIDYSKFREDIDIEKAVEILNWTMLGYAEKGLKLRDKFENKQSFVDFYSQEWRKYSDLLKDCFYK